MRSDPPWEAIQILISNVATNAMDSRKLMFMDISKAYFFALVVQPHFFIDLLLEDHQEVKCGRLKKALYGTRDAAHAWEEYTNTLVEFGFTSRGSSTCILRHKELDMELVVHGDDFTVSGNCDVLWFSEDFGTKYIVKIRGCLAQTGTIEGDCFTQQSDHLER